MQSAIVYQYAMTHGIYRRVGQRIVLPAANMVWGRVITTDHPRQPWKRLGEITPSTFIPEDGHNTAVPFVGLMQITDAEFDALFKGEMERNVTLRYQRGLEALGAVLVGKGALDDGDISRAYPDKDEYRVAAERIAEKIAVGDVDGFHDLTLNGASARDTGNPYRDEAYIQEHYGTGKPAAAPVVITAPPAAVTDVGYDVRKPVKAGAVLTRPNGQPYRAIPVNIGSKTSDIQMYREAADAGEHIFLFGPPGTGKSASMEVAFPGLYILIGSKDVEMSDLIGSWVPVVDHEGRESFSWEDGPLIRAMEEGRKFFIDEIALIPSPVLSMIYSVMDGRDEIAITSNPLRGTVKAQPGFSIVAATNPDAPGAVLSEALLSRFGLKVEVHTDFATMREMGVEDRMVTLAEHLHKQFLTGEAAYVPQARELLRFQRDNDRLGAVYALRNFLNAVPEEERDIIQSLVKDKWGDIPRAEKMLIPLRVGGEL